MLVLCIQGRGGKGSGGLREEIVGEGGFRGMVVGGG